MTPGGAACQRRVSWEVPMQSTCVCLTVGLDPQQEASGEHTKAEKQSLANEHGCRVGNPTAAGFC